MSVDCRNVAYTLSMEPGVDTTYQVFFNQLEFAIIGKNNIFKRYNDKISTELLLYLLPVGDRVNECIKDYLDKDFVDNCIRKNIRVIVILFREGMEDEPSHSEINLTCEWLQVNKSSIEKKLIMESSITNNSIKKLKEYISCDAERITLHYGLVGLVLI